MRPLARLVGEVQAQHPAREWQHGYNGCFRSRIRPEVSPDGSP